MLVVFSKLSQWEETDGVIAGIRPSGLNQCFTIVPEQQVQAAAAAAATDDKSDEVKVPVTKSVTAA